MLLYMMNETTIITVKEVKSELLTVLKFKLFDTFILNICINELFKPNGKPKYWHYKDYYTFLHTDFKNKVIEKYDHYLHKTDLLKFN